MRPIRLIPDNTKIDFIGRRLIAFAFSALLVLGSVLVIATQGLNFGIDFRGGILMEVRTEGPADIASMRNTLSGLGVGQATLQEFGGPRDVMIRIPHQEGGEAAQMAAIEQVRGALGPGVEYRRTEFVGPQVGDELIRAGILAVVLAIGGILAYVSFRFEWQFGVAAVAALTHDVIATIGLFALTQMEFSLSTVAAVLTVAGYSINDTVVVFDRVREDLRRHKSTDLPTVLNTAINQTLARTLITSGTTLLAVLALVVFGGEVIRGFSIALIWGIGIGTYSSICVAVPLLLYLNVRRGRSGGAGRKDQAAAAGSA
ncbi:protein translocase subunit SecF [Skermanella sp. TT6]|uniref:Protein-export membrane protein SecF n=1 Tax=Skermanella cutis TaxID=2775420 RepID=A0ABX7BB06_9PROT|nr:protein translocase subunit SecF [Skermanella sp. TT6]QQP91585.1 protein translocase subunit SecF [Skermanella sp. TT6]